MCVFGGLENSQSAFLGLKRRRDCTGVSYKAFFGAFFSFFGVFFAKSDLLFAKIERNGAVFGTFEKDTRVFALKW